MLRIKVVVGSVLGLLVGIQTLSPWVGSSLPQRRIVDEPQVSKEGQRQISALKAEVARLRQALESESESAVAGLAMKPESSAIIESVTPPELPAARPLSIEEERGALEDQFLELQAERFAEGRDVDWAESVESEVVQVLNIPGSLLERFECGRTLCELHATHEDMGRAEAFRLAMIAPLSDALASARWRVEGDRTIAFFIRKGSPWPPVALAPLRGRL